MKTAEHGQDLASLQALVDSLPAFIFTNRPDGHLDYCNQHVLEYLGVPFEAFGIPPVTPDRVQLQQGS